MSAPEEFFKSLYTNVLIIIIIILKVLIEHIHYFYSTQKLILILTSHR